MAYCTLGAFVEHDLVLTIQIRLDMLQTHGQFGDFATRLSISEQTSCCL